MLNKTEILDCTLRDGGYYNNWDFSIELIQKYIHAVQMAGVDYVELGYRTKNNSGYYGPLAYTTEDFIEELNINQSIKLGVMINSSELIQSKNLQLVHFTYNDIISIYLEAKKYLDNTYIEHIPVFKNKIT